MAIYRLEAKIIGRRAKDKTGKPIQGRSVSVVAKAAYRSGEKLHDDKQDRTYNYRSRNQQVVHSELVIPDIAPEWLTPSEHVHDSERRERLWNAIEQAEKRVDSQLAREFVVALPIELQDEQKVGLVRLWCSQEFASQGYVADFALHASHDGHNPHAHILCTLRPVEGDGFGKKPDMSGKFNGQGSVGMAAKSDLQSWRESWEIRCNEALAAAGLDVRIDHRSLKDQGIDREPEPKIGVDAMGMQRRGAEEDPYRVRTVRQTRMENELRPSVRAVEHTGETAMANETEGTWHTRLAGGFTYLMEEAKAMLRDESSGPRAPAPPLPDPQPEGRKADFEPEL